MTDKVDNSHVSNTRAPMRSESSRFAATWVRVLYLFMQIAL